jgi:hypothetical protein
MKTNPWLIGGGILALLLVTRKASAAVMPPIFETEHERDLDALADMLITETGFRKTKAEMSAIVFIAVNRARSQKKPIWYVVQPGTRSSGSCPTARSTQCLQWNSGSAYRRLFENARNNTNWLEARSFASNVLGGAYPNPGATVFVHPGHSNFDMPCGSNPNWSPSYVPGYGTRCIPTWAHKGKVIGSGLFA